MESKKDELEKYFSDITTIKRLMHRYEELPMLEHWGFYGWGILIIAGTILNHIFRDNDYMSEGRHFLLIWIPIFIIGGLIETLAWWTHFKKNDTPITTKKMSKIYISMILSMIAIMIIFYHMIPILPTAPGIMLLVVSIMYAFVAQGSFGTIFIESGIILATGITFLLFHVHGPLANIVCGSLIGISMIVVGIHSKIIETQNRNGK